MGKRLVVGALIVDDVEHPSRVLAARRSTPPIRRWEFPGGKAEPGETAQVALVREVQEELFATVAVDRRLDPPVSARAGSIPAGVCGREQVLAVREPDRRRVW